MDLRSVIFRLFTMVHLIPLVSTFYGVCESWVMAIHEYQDYSGKRLSLSNRCRPWI